MCSDTSERAPADPWPHAHFLHGSLKSPAGLSTKDSHFWFQTCVGAQRFPGRGSRGPAELILALDGLPVQTVPCGCKKEQTHDHSIPFHFRFSAEFKFQLESWVEFSVSEAPGSTTRIICTCGCRSSDKPHQRTLPWIMVHVTVRHHLLHPHKLYQANSGVPCPEGLEGAAQCNDRVLKGGAVTPSDTQQ